MKHAACVYIMGRLNGNERFILTVQFVIDTVRVFLSKFSLTTVRSWFSVDELQIDRGEAEVTFVVRPH